MTNLMTKAQTSGRDVYEYFGEKAKLASDHTRRDTGNKVWNATWCDRLADMISITKKNWDNTSKTSVTKLFLMYCETPMPKSQGAYKYISHSSFECQIVTL
jgi:hypothetical protein